MQDKFLRILGMCALATLLTQASVLAQGNSEMYSPEYVKDLMKPERPRAKVVTKPTLNEDALPDQPPTLGQDAPSDIEPKQVRSDSEQRQGVRVKKVGGIFGTASEAEIAKSIRELTALADQLAVPLGEIFFILSGIPETLSRETFEPLKKRGADAHFKLFLPREYSKVQSSPTWIISTAKGDVLLEGPISPSEFFNSKGEFVEPKGEASLTAVESPTAIPMAVPQS